jgi:hypothetical protein
MKEIEKTVYEEAVLALCKLAYVKWPLQLVGKKIAFIVNCGGTEVKIYDAINRVVISKKADGSGFASLCLNNVGQDGNKQALVYVSDEKKWEYCQIKDYSDGDGTKVESMVFETKLFGLFTI